MEIRFMNSTGRLMGGCRSAARCLRRTLRTSFGDCCSMMSAAWSGLMASSPAESSLSVGKSLRLSVTALLRWDVEEIALRVPRPKMDQPTEATDHERWRTRTSIRIRVRVSLSTTC